MAGVMQILLHRLNPGFSDCKQSANVFGNNLFLFLVLLFLNGMDFEAYKKEFSQAAHEQGYTDQEIENLIAYASNLHKQGLPIIFDQYHLSLLVGYDYAYLLAISNFQVGHYIHYKIPKRDGGTRDIEEPYPSLKEIQSWVLRNILEPASKFYVSPVAKAFMPGKSLRENARFHRNKRTVVALDLHDFFGSIHFFLVYGTFVKLGYNKSVSMMLTKLCMLRGSLPQGAPTSPMLSNLIFYELDNRIFAYCTKRKIMYTRYADDLTFSGDDINIGSLISYIKMLMGTRHFVLNEAKTNVMGRGTCQRVTGVVVNQLLQVPKRYRDKVRQEVYYSIKYGFRDHMTHLVLPSWCNTEKLYRHHLLGKINYILGINPQDEEFQRYSQWLKNYDKMMGNM